MESFKECKLASTTFQKVLFNQFYYIIIILLKTTTIKKTPRKVRAKPLQLHYFRPELQINHKAREFFCTITANEKPREHG